MSPLRLLKAKLGMYQLFSNNIDTNNFYQFALNEKDVKTRFQSKGFKLVYSESYDGIKGFKDEVKILKLILQKLYDYRGNNFILNRLKKYLDRIFNLYAAHMMFIIFKKVEKDDQKIRL